NFLTTDGEKEWRKRDHEFEEDTATDKKQMLALWEKGWSVLLQEIDQLRDEDLEKEITIRGEPHLVLDALLRQVAHYAYHVGQIVYIAKHLKGADWETLSIPKGKTAEFNRKMRKANEK